MLSKHDPKGKTTMMIYASFYIKKEKEKMRFTQVWSLMFSELRSFCKSFNLKKLGDSYFGNALQTGSEARSFCAS
jgi:hypothetical protein